MFIIGRWHQMFLHSQVTLPASPTPTSPTKMLLRITTLASLVLYSFASLVSCKICFHWSGAAAPDVLSWSLFWPLPSSLSLQAVWMSQESKLASTRSMCSSLGFLMRKWASTNQTAMLQTTMSNTPSTDSQRDHYLVSPSNSHFVTHWVSEWVI